jgi:hypothetical protein
MIAVLQLEVFYDAYSITYRTIRDQLTAEAKRMGVPLRVRFAEVLTGVTTGPAMLPCFILEHPVHSAEYFSYCITPGQGHYSGNDGFFVWLAGDSKQLRKAEYNRNTSETNGIGWTGAAAGVLRGGSTGAGLVIGGIAFEAGHGVMVSAKKVWNAFTMDKQALEQELAWYEQVREIMDSELG